MVTGSARLGPFSDCNVNCRPVFSSGRAHPIETRPQISDSNIPTGSNIWSRVPQGCSISRHTDLPNISRKVTSSHLMLRPFSSKLLPIHPLIFTLSDVTCRWQRPCGLSHELSLPTPTLRSWVCVRLFCVCVVLCLGSGQRSPIDLRNCRREARIGRGM
jgi:hypothetical protein